MTLFATLLLGFLLGMRHATDADHVVAVSTIVTRERTTRAAMLVGALWGLGHALTLFLVGGAIVLFGVVIPTRLGLSMELCVAVMLVSLGMLNVTGALRGVQGAEHGRTHLHAPGSPESRRSRFTRTGVARFLIVGIVHGLAGSAAVALLVLATIRETKWALLYLLVFGGGTVLGMLSLTSAMALPLAAAARRFPRFEAKLARATGLVSIAFGLVLAYQIGFVDGLFLPHPIWTPE
ncbi:MAG TPA: high-affinity nickel-transport family protein [Polyangiaceae bacterium]|nr:high-affinity nickel-transport family protein [Polyangiaceae bacterium]